MRKQLLQPIDRISLSLIFLLSIVISILVWGGEACGNNCFAGAEPGVKKFSWQGKKIGALDTAFIVTFDRQMDEESVAENLIIEPELPGKISWAGRRMAYTLETPAPYGNSYQVYLEGAKEKLRGENKEGAVMKPFVGEFSTRDRALAYIGVEGSERGRLILCNLTKQEKKIITPPSLVVSEFKSYPKGDRILFAATEGGNNNSLDNQLYTVTTGISGNKAGHVKRVLDNKKYQNLKFELSQDGETIVVARANKKNPEDFGMWMIKGSKKPQRWHKESAGEFLIAPDSQTIAVAQGQGIAILPLEADAKPLDFLPQFGRVVTFSRDGQAAAMVNFNTDNPELLYQQSLFVVNNQGIEKKLLDTDGSIMDCKFNPTVTTLYCLLTDLIEGQREYTEKPYFAAIDLNTAEVSRLWDLPKYQDIEISMASDRDILLFDRVITANTLPSVDDLTTNLGEAIVGSSLWLLKPSSESGTQLEELPLVGFRPQWLP